jgi:hypothetical protein
MSSDRREFLGTLLAAGAAPMLVGPAARRNVASAMSGGAATVRAASDWDVSWVDKITGKHRAVFDSVAISEGLGLLRALIWMNDYKEVYGTTPADTSAVVVLRHAAIWLIMDDQYWSQYKIGALTKIIDPTTKQPITRNPTLGATPFELPPALANDALKNVLASGTVLACNLAFNLFAVGKVQAEGKLSDADAHAQALKHVVPGIILQPSGVFATLRAQEAGCNYILATDA